MAKFPDPSSSCPLPFIYFFNFNNDPLNYDPHDLSLLCKYNMSYTGPWDLIIQIKNQDLEIQLLLKATGAHTDNFRNYVTLLARSEVVVK